MMNEHELAVTPGPASCATCAPGMKWAVEVGRRLAAAEGARIAEVAGQLAVSGLADWCLIDVKCPVDASLSGQACAIAGLAPDDHRCRRLAVRLGDLETDPDTPPLKGPLPERWRSIPAHPLPSRANSDPSQVQLDDDPWGPATTVRLPLAMSQRCLGSLMLGWSAARGYPASDVIDVARDFACRVSVALWSAGQCSSNAALLRQRGEFLAILSHELRNPLAAILAGSSLLRRCGKVDPLASRAVEALVRQGRLMQRLLDDLLDFTRLAEGKIALRRQRICLRGPIREAVSARLPELESRQQRFVLRLTEAPMTVNGDPVRIAQVFSNLLANASKYTPRGGLIRLEAWMTGDSAHVRVTDNGRGMPDQVVDRIFEPFFQIESTLDRNDGGLGVGLTMVERLVRAHGGTVKATSLGPGRGSQFDVTLPLAQPLGSAPRPRGARCAPLVGSVLLIEDHADMRDMLEALLSLAGHKVESAATGEAGLRLLLEESYDLALVDIGLPGLDGYALARAFHQQKSAQPTMLVAATGYDQPADRRRAAEAGFDEHLAKPYDLEDVQRLLAKALDRRLARQ